MNITQIPVSSIQTHWELNRVPNQHHVHALARHMNEKGFDKQFPLRVIKTLEGTFHLAAGHHRYKAATMEDITYPNLPLTEVWAEVISGNVDTLIRIMQEDNFQHDPGVNPDVGLPLTGPEKKTQCQRLLMFREYFEQSNRALEEPFGVSYRTVARWREEVAVTLSQLAKQNLSDNELLVNFSITPARLTEMLSLIESGEREVTQRRGSTTTTSTVKTQASAEKKRDAKAEAIEAFREQSGLGLKALDFLASQYPSQPRPTIKRRLWDAFDLEHAANAGAWAVEKITSETAKYEAMLVELRDADRPWREEFFQLHCIEVDAQILRDLGGPYETETEQVLAEVAKISRGDFEAIEQGKRLKVLRLLSKQLRDVLHDEQTARAAAEKARKLNVAISGAQAACRRLREMFIVSRFEDTSQLGYQAFLSAACTEGAYSSKSLSVEMFISPQDLQTEEQGNRIRSIADRIRVDLGTAEPPAWIASRLPAPEPAPPPAPEPAPEPEWKRLQSQICEKIAEPTVAAMKDNTPVIDPRYAELSKKGYSVVWESLKGSASGVWRILNKREKNKEVHRQFGQKEAEQEILARAQEIAAATESFARPELTPTEPAIDEKVVRQCRDAANSMGAVLPLTSRAMPSVIASLDKQLREQCPNDETALDVLRNLILRRLRTTK